MASSTAADAKKPNRKPPRPREKALSYSIGHRIRIEIVAALNEGPRSADQLAKIVRQPVNNVIHHLEELLKDGSIEVAWTEPVRNLEKTYYRAIKQVFYSDEEFAELTPEEKKITVTLPLQSIMAEALSALWAGTMLNDPNLWISWRWFNVDSEGRQEIADEQEAFWERMKEIEARSMGRRTGSGEDATTVIVTELGFERSRPSFTPPATVPDGEGEPASVRQGKTDVR